MNGFVFLGWALALLMACWFALLVWSFVLIRKFEQQERTYQCLNRQY